jgi:acyl-CoA synthetase (AMP-forming)/AMP-acid ligase II
MKMTHDELDRHVTRLNAAEGSKPGFRGARVALYSPPVVAIEFDDNAAAEMYAAEKQLIAPTKWAVDPANGSTVRQTF